MLLTVTKFERCAMSVRIVSTKFRAEISAMCQKTKDSAFTKPMLFPNLCATSDGRAYMRPTVPSGTNIHYQLSTTQYPLSAL